MMEMTQQIAMTIATCERRLERERGGRERGGRSDVLTPPLAIIPTAKAVAVFFEMFFSQ